MAQLAPLPVERSWPTLPLLRDLHDYAASGPEPFRELVAIYPDRLVIVAHHRDDSVPTEAGEKDGYEALRALRSKDILDVAWADVQSATIAGPLTRGSRLTDNRASGWECRFQFADGDSHVIFLPDQEAERFGLALNETLGSRVTLAASPVASRVTRRRPFWALCGFLVIPTGVALVTSLGLALTWLLFGLCRPQVRVYRFRTALRMLVAAAVVSGGMAALALLALPLAVFGPAWLVVAVPLGLLVSGSAGARGIGRLVVALSTQVVRLHQRLPAKKPERLFSKSTRKLPWRNSAAGVILKVAGTGTFLLAHSLFRSPGAAGNNALSAPISILAPLLLGIVGFAFVYLGYRVSLPTAAMAVFADPRPPIVMLRSFVEDGKNDYNPKGSIAEWLGLAPARIFKWLGPIANVHPLRLVRLLFSTPNDNAEEQLTSYLKKFGPVIAIGRPGEAIASGGAARFYVPDSRWQPEIEEKIASAQLLVVQPGDSPGIWWETEHAVRSLPLDKILFSVVHFAGAQHLRIPT